tara:strand:+ start:201 stop:398 length:198 start_codon:yes stop_codon:yes gene_type:complete
MAETKNRAWQIEIQLPKGRIKTHVYSDTGEDIVNRFPNMDCKVIGPIDDPLLQTKAQPKTEEKYI